MKVRINLQIYLFSPCKGSLSTTFRENYTLIQTAGDMKKRGGGLEGARCFLLEALREKKSRINPSTGSMIILPTKYTRLSVTQPQDWVQSDRFGSEIAQCCAGAEKMWKKRGFREFPQSPGSPVRWQGCISSAHEKLFCVFACVHMRTHIHSSID